MPLHAAIIQKLLSTNSHIGRRLTSNHLKPHLSAVRNHLPILDSDKTIISLRTALAFISHLSTPSPPARPARFLFVNTNPLYDDIFNSMTRLTGHTAFLSPQAQFWRAPGFLTNPHSPKRFRGRNKRLCFAPVDPPDCVVVVDTEGKCSVVNEAARLGVPVVAVVNSSVDGKVFDKIAYPVVVGCETVQFVYLFCNLITKTFLTTRGKGIAGVLDDDMDVNVGDIDGGSGVVDGNVDTGMNANDDGGVRDVYASSDIVVLGEDGGVLNGSGSGSGSFGDVGGIMNTYASSSGVFGDDGGVLNGGGGGSGSGVFGDDDGLMNAYASSSGVFGDDGGDGMNHNMYMDGGGSGSGVFEEGGDDFNANGNDDGLSGTTPSMSSP